METYYTKVSVQADRYIVETEKPTIIVENEEEFNKRYGTNTGKDCGCDN